MVAPPSPFATPDDTGDHQVVRRPRRGTSRRWSWPKRLLVGGVACVVVGALVVGAGAAWGLWSFSKITRVDLDLAEPASASEPINVLVVGSDSRAEISEGDPGSGGMLGDDAPTGQRSDSLLIARIDPTSDRIDLLSIPRDLWVTIAGTGREQRINTAYSQSAQAVVDTVQDSLGIPINNFVEVDFSGFQTLVEAIGGVPMYFDHPVRDRNSGLDIGSKGCQLLDGPQGLAFARSRHLEWNDGSGWVSDPTGDLGRMTRQQLLTRAALSKAQTLGLNDVGRLKSLVDAGIGSVKLDATLGTGELIDLGERLGTFDPDRLQTHSLPVTGFRTEGGAEVVLLDQAVAQPTLDIFRGTATPTVVTTTTAPPPSNDEVAVEVVNASGLDGEARRVSFVLTEADFLPGAVLPSETIEPRTVLTYARGQKLMAELVAGWITASPELDEDKRLAPGTVRVTLGADFDKVAEPDESAATQTTEAPVDQVADPAAPTTTSTTTTTQPGWTPGVPPQGTSCR